MRYPLPPRQEMIKKLARTLRNRRRWMFSSFWFSCSSTMDSCIGTNPTIQWNTTFDQTVKCLHGSSIFKTYVQRSSLPHSAKPFCKTDLQIPANLEAGGDGGVLIVCSFRVSYQVVPAGEHLPAEGEVPLLSSVPSLICVTSHPERKENPDASSALM